MYKLKKYCIIACTVLSVFASSLIVTKAAGTQATLHTLYKSNSLGNAYEYVVISVEFADYTSGTIVIEVTNLSFYDYMVFGARLSNIYSSGNTRRLTLQVDDCKQVIIYCLPHAGSMISLSPSIYSNNTSYVEHVNQSFIESQFTTTNGYIDDLESTCSNIYTDVHNIYLMLVDQAGDLDNIQTQLTNIGNYLNTTNSNLSSINTNILTISQQLSLIDSQIDAISWTQETSNYDLTWSDSINGSYVNTAIKDKSDLYYKIKILNNPSYTEDCIRKFLIPFGRGDWASYDPNYTIEVFNGRYENSQWELAKQDIPYYTVNTFTYLELYLQSYIGSTNNTNAQYTIIHVHSDNPTIRTYNLSSYPFSAYKISSNDIEYWQLLQTFNQYKFYKEQLENDINQLQEQQETNDLVQQLINIVSELSINSQETTTNIINFNTNMEIINDIENDLSVNFNGTNTLFKNNNDGNWDFITSLQTPASSLNSVFNATITNFYPTKNWLAIIMLCAVILALLG